MNISRIWLAAAGLIVLATMTLYVVGIQIVAPNFDAYLPYMGLLCFAWAICIPSLLRIPAIFARKGRHGETIRIDISRRTIAMLAFFLCIGFIPAQPFTTLLVAIFGKLMGLGMALTLASTLKQSQKPIEDKDHG